MFDRAVADDGPVAGAYIRAEPFRAVYRQERRQYLYRASVAALAIIAAAGWGAFLYDRSPLYPAARGDRQASEGSSSNDAIRASPLKGESSAPVALAAAVAPVRVVRAGRPERQDLTPTAGREPAPVASQSAAPEPLAERRRDLTPTDLTPTGLAASDFSGAWILSTGLEPLPGQEMAGPRPAYRLDLAVNGRRVTGVAQKIGGAVEQGDRAFLSTVPIEGTFDGKRLVVTFAGRTAADQGRFVLYTEGKGLLRGRYSVAGANGVVEGRRQ